MVEQEISCFKEDIQGRWLQIAMKRSAVVLQVGGKAMHELDYSSRSLMQLCTTRHPLLHPARIPDSIRTATLRAAWALAFDMSTTNV